MDTSIQQVSVGAVLDTSIFERVNREVQAYVDQVCAGCESPRVLEAGSGSRSHMQLPPRATLVGMDISQAELDRHSALDEAILGDIQTYPLKPESFDLIVCWDVLEHVSRPVDAMENFARALRPGGMVVIGSPVVHSLKGFVTKFTPLWFHAWVFQYLVHGGKRNQDWQSGPFRTFLRSSMSPDALRRFAQDQELQVEHLHIYQAPIQQRLRARHFAIDLAFRIGAPLLKLASFGRIDPDVTDFVMVLKKPRAEAQLIPAASAMARSA
jgi:SAM-dependent methyltransferase